MQHESGAFDASPEEVYSSSFTESEDILFKQLQGGVIQAELKDHPEMSAEDWLVAYASIYRSFINKNKDILERYNKAETEERARIIAEIRRRLAQ